MYNAHRGVPPGPQPGNRLGDLLEQVRQEFEQQAGRSSEHEHARKYYPSKSWRSVGRVFRQTRVNTANKIAQLLLCLPN